MDRKIDASRRKLEENSSQKKTTIHKNKDMVGSGLNI